MRRDAASGSRRVVGFTSQHTVVLAMGWPKSETRGLLGFAVRRRNPDATVVWLEGLLSFEEQGGHAPGSPIPSNEGPFQKMYWADYRVRPASPYEYQVIPVYGRPGHLDLREAAAVRLAISTESNEGQTNQVYFNRAVIASQAYVRNFGLVDPESDPSILAWLARGLDEAILNFIHRAAADPSLKLDVAAYHLEHPAILEALATVGDRARVSICWRKPDDQERGKEAARVLGRAGVEVFKRRHVPAISHNKYIVLKNSRDEPQAVLMGSTNFTVGGVSLQNNVSHIIGSPDLARLYLQAFELQIAEDNEALKEQDAEWTAVDGIELNFSPHTKGSRVDLDRYVSLVQGARSSLFFATFRATDEELLTALTRPAGADVVVRGLVDKVYEQSPGDVVLYHEAHERDPAVVPATPLSRAVDPLTAELARKGYNPLVHHKFILIDHDTPNSTVITGSANYSNNSSERNDENTLIIHRDQRVGEMYLAELFRLYEHYRSRWLLNRRARQRPSAVYLVPDDSWTEKYYGNTQAARLLKNLLS